MADDNSAGGLFAEFWLHRRPDVDAIAMEVALNVGCPWELMAFGLHVHGSWDADVEGLYARLESETSESLPRRFRRKVVRIAEEVAKDVLENLVDERARAGARQQADGRLNRIDIEAAANRAAYQVRRMIRRRPDDDWLEDPGSYALKAGINEVKRFEESPATRPEGSVDFVTDERSLGVEHNTDFVLDQRPIGTDFNAPDPMSEGDHDRLVDPCERISVDGSASGYEDALGVPSDVDEWLRDRVTAAMDDADFDVIEATALVVANVLVAWPELALGNEEIGAARRAEPAPSTRSRVRAAVERIWTLADGVFERSADGGRVGVRYRERNRGRRRGDDLPLILDRLLESLDDGGPAAASLAEAVRVARTELGDLRDRRAEQNLAEAARKWRERKIAAIASRVVAAIGTQGAPPDAFEDHELWAMILECTRDQLQADSKGGTLHPEYGWDADRLDAWLEEHRDRLITKVRTSVEAIMGNVEDEQ